MEDGIMKKSLVFAVALFTLAACTWESSIDTPAGNMIVTARTETSAITRTIIEGETHVYWEPGDEIKVFAGGNSGKFITYISASSSIAEFHGALCVGGGGSSNSLVLVNSTLSCPDKGIGIGYKISTANGNPYSGSASLANKLDIENSTVSARILDVNGYLDAAGIDGPKAVVRVAGTNSTISVSANSRKARLYNTELVFDIDPEGFVQTLVNIPKIDISSNSVVKVNLPSKARKLLGGRKVTLVQTEPNQLAIDETTTFAYSAEMCDLVADAASGEIYINVKHAPGFSIFVR